MNDTEKDILIEIMRQNIVEKERYIYELIRENLKLKAQAAPKPKEGQAMGKTYNIIDYITGEKHLGHGGGNTLTWTLRGFGH